MYYVFYRLVSSSHFIHAFNKSGRHLEFTINDVIRGKIIHVAKWLPKIKALLRYVHVKRMFLLYIKRNIFFMSLWVCYRNFKAFVQRYPRIDDIEGKRELI